MQREGLGAVGLRMERAKFLGLIEVLEENLKEEGRESNEVALSQVLHGMDGPFPRGRAVQRTFRDKNSVLLSSVPF